MINDLKNLTLDEKITLLTGKDAWNIHDIPKLDKFNMADGPCGLRKVSFWTDGTTLNHRSISYASHNFLNILSVLIVSAIRCGFKNPSRSISLPKRTLSLSWSITIKCPSPSISTITSLAVFEPKSIIPILSTLYTSLISSP